MPFDEAAHPRAATGEFTADTGPGREGKSVLGLKAKGASLPKEEKGGGKGKGKGGKGAGKGEAKPAQVKSLQQALAKAGFKGADGKPLKADGIIGPNTTAAIKAAQRKYGMKPDGKLTPELVRHLTKPRMAKAQLAASARARKPLRKPAASVPPKTARPAPSRRFPSPRDSAPVPDSGR